MNYTLEVKGMHCASCVGRVERALARVPGVELAVVSLLGEKASVHGNDQVTSQQLMQAVEKAGFQASSSQPVQAPDLLARWSVGLLLGALIMTGVFLQSAYDMYDPDYGYTVLLGIGGVFVMGVGALLAGVVLMIVWNIVAPPFFRGETLHHDTPVLVPDV